MRGLLIISYLLIIFGQSGMAQENADLFVVKKNKTVHLDLGRINSVEVYYTYRFNGKAMNSTDSTLQFHVKRKLNRENRSADTIIELELESITTLYYCTKGKSDKCRTSWKAIPLYGLVLMPSLYIFGVGLLQRETRIYSLGAAVTVLLNELIWFNIRGQKKYDLDKWSLTSNPKEQY